MKPFAKIPVGATAACDIEIDLRVLDPLPQGWTAVASNATATREWAIARSTPLNAWRACANRIKPPPGLWWITSNALEESGRVIVQSGKRIDQVLTEEQRAVHAE